MASLLRAAEAGDLSRVQQLYDTKVKPSEQPKTLSGIACAAAQHDQPGILEWCFSKGLAIPTGSPSDPTINDELSKHALWGGHIPIYQVLLKHGFDLNAHYNEISGDALTSAASEGNQELTRWLLDHGHNPNSRAGIYNGHPAVIQAIDGRKPSLTVLKLLVDHGVDINGSGAVIAAAEEGKPDALKLLVETGKANLEKRVLWYGVTDKESVDAEGTALFRACYKGQEQTAKYLLAKGADRDAKDKKGRTCMEVAKERGHTEVVELLEG